jgi:hypothetical protein
MPKFPAVLALLVSSMCGELLGQERAGTEPAPQIIIQVLIVERDLKGGYTDVISRPQITAVEHETAVKKRTESVKAVRTVLNASCVNTGETPTVNAPPSPSSVSLENARRNSVPAWHCRNFCQPWEPLAGGERTHGKKFRSRKMAANWVMFLPPIFLHEGLPRYDAAKKIGQR